MKYLVNSFTQRMLDTKEHLIKIEKCTKKEVWQNKKECVSAIGHAKIGRQLQVNVNRMHIQLEKGDIAYIVSTDTPRHNNAYPDQIIPETVRYQKLTVVE